ncbi:MAG TPA: hypothetical protein VKE96_18875 [Vicinamibacterales bacterium]|nr:hypothetical protein [Vicinamibacterales bacterium]
MIETRFEMSIQEVVYWEYVISVIAVVTLKITCFVLSYLTIRLGHGLIASGAKGEFKFSARIGGSKADLASVSPGLLFVLLAIALAGFAIGLDKPVHQDIALRSSVGLAEDADKLTVPSRVEKPDFKKPGVKP